MYGLTLILVLVVMGGAIAYIGDKLGSKVGKRKLTVFGLRPKHTSILVTIITGFLIAATTLGVLTIVSKDVRTALFGMEELKTELSSLSAEVFKQNKELTVSRSDLAAKTAEYLELTKKIQHTATQLIEAEQQLATVAAERDQTTVALSAIQSDYTIAKNDLAKAKQAIDELSATKAQLDRRVAELNTAKTQLEADVKRLNEVTVNLKRGLQIVREGSIVFRAGEVVSTDSIKHSDSREKVERELTDFIISTNRFILDRMGMADKRVEALWLSQTDFESLVNLIEGAKTDYVVRIIATGNTIYGESVIGQFEVFPNKLLYPKDQTLHTETVSNASKDAEETVLQFLTKVNAQAVKKGILTDPLQGTVGAISGYQLFDAVKQLQKLRGAATLTAITTQDIYTIGPLKIRIDVKATVN